MNICKCKLCSCCSYCCSQCKCTMTKTDSLDKLGFKVNIRFLVVSIINDTIIKHIYGHLEKYSILFEFGAKHIFISLQFSILLLVSLKVLILSPWTPKAFSHTLYDGILQSMDGIFLFLTAESVHAIWWCSQRWTCPLFWQSDLKW